MVEDLVSDQDPQNELDLDDPTKELYLGDQQNPEKEFYSNSTHCELSRQYPLNKLYLDEPEYKFYLGDSQILKKSVNEFCLDGLNNYLGDSGKGFCQDGSKYGTYLGDSQILKKISK